MRVFGWLVLIVVTAAAMVWGGMKLIARAKEKQIAKDAITSSETKDPASGSGPARAGVRNPSAFIPQGVKIPASIPGSHNANAAIAEAIAGANASIFDAVAGAASRTVFSK